MDIKGLLRQHAIQPTSQRVLITRLVLERCTHLSAEDVHRLVNVTDRRVSKATVYNTLGLLTEKGVIREVIADPSRACSTIPISLRIIISMMWSRGVEGH